jgi:hypothetical protein
LHNEKAKVGEHGFKARVICMHSISAGSGASLSIFTELELDRSGPEEGKGLGGHVTKVGGRLALGEDTVLLPEDLPSRVSLASILTQACENG